MSSRSSTASRLTIARSSIGRISPTTPEMEANGGAHSREGRRGLRQAAAVAFGRACERVQTALRFHREPSGAHGGCAGEAKLSNPSLLWRLWKKDASFPSSKTNDFGIERIDYGLS